MLNGRVNRKSCLKVMLKDKGWNEVAKKREDMNLIKVYKWNEIKWIVSLSRLNPFLMLFRAKFSHICFWLNCGLETYIM